LTSYELTYILRPLEEANLTAANERITAVLQNAGGEIVARNDWGRRRLAYPIKKIPDGYYSTLYINLPGTAVRGVERSLELIDDVLRYLVVRVETHRLPTPAPEAPSAPAADAPAPAQAGAPDGQAAETPSATATAAAIATAETSTATPATAHAEVAAPAAEPVPTAEGS
jgi:small subunit ribosomal protein S6